ncbi:MAG: hypothetical protein HY973_01820 [Candidatus Kerfeldbacteria bacterium]|nr:hypothetical protein [Candidatus Kerfeldbacteria bacterium]
MLNIIVPNKLRMVKKILTIGSGNPKTRAREGGASVFTSFVFLFFLSVPSPEKSAGGFQQAGKKWWLGGGMPSRPSEIKERPATF